MDAASHTTAILLVFLSDDKLQTIEYIHIRLVVCHAGCQLYKEKDICLFIRFIQDHLGKVRAKVEASESSGGACSCSMFLANFGGLMAVPTEPPYCLVYPNIYTASVPPKDRNHFNVQGGLSRLCTHVCICHTLLQHADLSKAHKQKYQALLIDLHMGELFPMVLVGTSNWWTRSSQGCPETVSCTTVMTSPNFRG